MKKIFKIVKIVLLCIISIVILAYATSYLIFCYSEVQIKKDAKEMLEAEKQEKEENKEEHQKLIEETLQEVDYINQNSNFGEIKLAKSPLYNFNAYGTNVFRNEEEIIGEYNCWEFNEDYCINEIIIGTTGGDFLGISTESSYDIAVECMQTENYDFEGEENYYGCIYNGKVTGYVYKKAYVTVIFAVSDDNIIKEVSIRIYDPYNEQLVE